MITLAEFKILTQLLKNKFQTQREIAEDLNMSLGKVNSVISELKNKDLINGNNAITNVGLIELEPYKVNNAVILSAGRGTWFWPPSCEKTKGAPNEKGEILIRGKN